MALKGQDWLGMIGMVLVLLGSGCSLEKTLTIADGSYTIQRSGGAGEYVPGPFIERLEVDRALGVVIFYSRKREPLRIPFDGRNRKEWPAGCPGNLYSQRMEIFDLLVDEESEAILGLSNPVLIRNCPETPYQLVLREDGEIGGPLSACSFPVECLFFLSSQEVENHSYQNLELLV